MFPAFRNYRTIWLYPVLLGMIVLMAASCSGSKKSPGMRQIEKHSKRNPIGEDGLPVTARGPESKKARLAMEKQRKQQEALDREAQKSYRDAITRHREVQTPEVRSRMDQRAKETEKKYGDRKEFFIVRWFRPVDDIEKIEKRRAKEVEKRMAATRKKAEKNNEMLRTSSLKTNERKAAPRPDPKDMPHGGGGTYKGGSATSRVNPGDMPHGGGGAYKGGSATSRVNPKDTPHGGGSSYAGNNSKNRIKPSDIQQGGGGTYREGKLKNLFSKKKKSTP